MRHPFFRRKIHLTRRMLSLPGSIKLISFVMLIYYLGWAIADPFLAIYFKEKLGTYTKLGIVYALFPLFSIIWVLIAGLIIDGTSKKKLINIGFLLYAPISIMILKISSMMHFVFFRLYHAMSASILWLAVESYLREHSPKKLTSEARGLFDASFGISLIIGPLIGAFLINYFGFSIFYAISIFAMLSFLFSLMLVDKKNNSNIKYSSFRRETSDFLKNVPLKRISIFYSLILFCVSFVGILLPLFLKEFGASYFQIGLVFALYNIPILFEAYFSVFKNKKRLLFSGILGASIIFLLMYNAASLYLLFVLSFLLGISIACIVPVIQGRITNLMPKNEIGELSAVLTAVNSIFQASGVFIAGLVSDYIGLNSVFLLAFVIFVILLSILTFTKYVELENA